MILGCIIHRVKLTDGFYELLFDATHLLFDITHLLFHTSTLVLDLCTLLLGSAVLALQRLDKKLPWINVDVVRSRHVEWLAGSLGMSGCKSSSEWDEWVGRLEEVVFAE